MAWIAGGSVGGWPPRGPVDLGWCSSSAEWVGVASEAETIVRAGWSASTRGTVAAQNLSSAPLAWPSSRAVQAGQRLGPYRLIERLGRGRQADVWRARRSGPGGEEVALKVIPACRFTQDPRRLAQLRHEAERGVKLVGPALLATKDFGEADGLVFLAMPLVVGCTLGAVLHQRRSYRAGGPPRPETHRLALAAEPAYVRTVARLLARVARAVDFAHRARVVHRDIKPMNILIDRDLMPDREPAPSPGTRDRPDPDDGVFLCDFGLARDLDVATPVQLRDGAGSPLYMAPERLRREPADEVKGDVYALGVTLFESLTLTPPVEMPPELPPPLWAGFLAEASHRRARDLRPDLPAALAEIAHRAMDRAPLRRPPNAGHFAQDLEDWIDGEFRAVAVPRRGREACRGGRSAW